MQSCGISCRCKHSQLVDQPHIEILLITTSVIYEYFYQHMYFYINVFGVVVVAQKTVVNMYCYS